MLPDENKYAGCEIYSQPKVIARPARDEDPVKGIKYRPARRAHEPRRGILPIGRTQFERLRNAAGKFPEPDAQLNGRPMWSGKLLNEFLAVKQGAES